MSTNCILSRSIATFLALAPFTTHAATQTLTPAGDPTDGSAGVNPSWGVAANWSGDNGAKLPGPGDLAQLLYGDSFFNAGVDISGSDFTGVPPNFTEVQGVAFVGAATSEVDLENNSTTANMTLALNGGGGTVPLIQTSDYIVRILGTGLGTVTPTTKTLTLQLKGSGDFNVTNADLTISAPITQSGGSFGFNKTGFGNITLNGTTANTYTGTTTVSGGIMTVSKTAGVNAIGGNLDIESGAYFTLGASDQIANTAAIIINGGTFGDPFNAGPAQGGPIDTVASVTLNGGAIGSNRNLTGFTATGLFKITNGGTAIAQRGGVFNGGSLEISSGGILDLDGGSTTGSNESRFNITSNTGTLTLSDATVNYNTGTIGGTSVGGILALKGTTASTVTATGTNNFIRVDTQNRPAVFDLGSAVRTISVPTAADSLTLGTGTAAVTISSTAAGGLIKTGAGTLSLSGVNSAMLGSLTVSGGLLAVNGGTATATIGAGSAITVQGTGTLALGVASTSRAINVSGGGKLAGVTGGTGVTGLTTVTTGGIIQPGDLTTGMGNLTLSTLKIGSSATDTAVLNLSTTSEIIVSTASGLTITSGTGKVTVNILGAAPQFGVFPVIDYATGINGSINSFAIGSTPVGQRVAYTLVNNQNATSIDLHVDVDVPVWKGALSSEWSTNTLANPKNWVLKSNTATTTDYLPTDSVLFNDVATNTTVDLSVEDVSPTAISFANATNNYTIIGSKAITGNIGLTKTLAGKVTISNTNSFTGAVTLSGGTITVASVADSGVNSPLGAGTTLAFGGGALEFTGGTGSTNRAVTLAGTASSIRVTGTSLTLTGVVSGTGAQLTKNGNGTLVLGGASANTYSGNTTVNAGTLVAGKPAGVNAIGGSLSIQAGSFIYAGNNTSNEIPDAASITLLGGTFGDPNSANPTVPGATDTVTNVTMAGGVFNSGSNANTPFTISNALTVSGGTVLAQRGGGISAKSVTVSSGGAVNLDGGMPGQTSNLIVGTSGLTLTGSSITMNAGPSTLTAASAGSVVTLNGNLTSTGTSSFARLNPSVSSATIDLGGAARTFAVNTGTLDIGSAAAPIAVTNGSIVKSGAGTLTISGTQSYTALTTNNTSGTTILNGRETLNTLTVGTGSVVKLAAHAGGTANVQPLVTTTLSIDSTGGHTGQLDITNNAMIVRNSTLAAVTAQIASGQNFNNNGYWDGPGITSSTAANDASNLTAIGVLNNAEFGYDSFAGVDTTAHTEILVKYTYYGDSDLDGVVTTDDFANFTAGKRGLVPAEWLNGDFDYDGVVTTDDFALFIAGRRFQAGQLKTADDAILDQEIAEMSTQLGAGSGSVSGGDVSSAAVSQAVVPEPGSMGLLACGALGLLGRRRRR